MRSAWMAASLAGAMIALTTLSAATAWAQIQSAPGAPAAGRLSEASGKIASVDTAQKKLVVQSGLFGTKQQFVIGDKAEITDGQRSLKLEDLKPGAEVTVQYTEQAGQQAAQSITVEGGGESEAKPGASKPGETQPAQNR